MIEAWNFILLQPMLNFLIILSSVFFSSFGLAIIVLTIIVRLLMLPLTLRQLRSTKAMTSLQPKLAEIQKKYAKDRDKLQKEMASLYKEAGVNPLGCLWPLLIQFPIWIALYQSIMKALAATPEDLLGLSQRLYAIPLVHQTVPLQKMTAMPAGDPRQQSMSRMMLWMMPLLFAFFTLQFPSGLALFWVVSNIIGIVIQYFITGWGGLEGTWQTLRAMLARARAPAAPAVGEGGLETVEGGEQQQKIETERATQEERVENGKPGGKRKDRRRGRRARPRKTRRNP